MLGFLIFYYCFSSLFCIGILDDTVYETKRGRIMAIITYAFMGPFLFPVALGVIVKQQMTKKY